MSVNLANPPSAGESRVITGGSEWLFQGILEFDKDSLWLRLSAARWRGNGGLSNAVRLADGLAN